MREEWQGDPATGGVSWQSRSTSSASAPVQSATPVGSTEHGGKEHRDTEKDAGKEDGGKKVGDKDLLHLGGEGERAETRNGGGQAHHVVKEGEGIADESGGLRETKELAIVDSGSRVAEQAAAAAGAQGAGERVFGVEYMFALADTVTGQVSAPTSVPTGRA